jgi:hypothetical protein
MAADVPPPPTNIDSDTFDAHSNAANTETTFVYAGHVVVTGNDIRMTCDNLTVITLRSGPKSDTIGRQDKFKYMLATGHVVIVQGDREASCGRAEVLPFDDKIVLTEDPIVKDHGNGSALGADKFELFKGERRAHGEGHVHTLLPAVKDLGFDKNLPPPPSAEPAKQP